jgi:UDP-N-acetylglucosamine diphosphorylase/glucosamine-1-phosphate N-acetyltransferase
MRICVYEDSGSQWLEPIALTRPAFALWCGAERLFERQLRLFAADEVGFWVRPMLAEVWKLEQPDHAVNDVDWAREEATVWINGRWLPGPFARIDAALPHVGIVNEQIAYVVSGRGELPSGETFEAWLAAWRDRLPSCDVGGTMIEYLWDAVEQNGPILKRDADWFRAEHPARPSLPDVAVRGPAEGLIVAEDATIEPFVCADTRGGPVLIDRGAVVHSFSRLEGPCYIGKESVIVGAKLRAGSTIGPVCKIGGEVEATIVQGYANKYHDGFLGHSYVGEWVNLAAGTQTSDLRNDYEKIKVTVNGQRVATGRNKVGSYVGDHAKTGLSALLNTGSSIGAFAHVLPAGTLLPSVIPSFCQVHHGQVQEFWDLRKTFVTAARVMQRRGKELTDAHRDLFYDLFEATAENRHKAIHADDRRRLRQMAGS